MLKPVLGKSVIAPVLCNQLVRVDKFSLLSNRLRSDSAKLQESSEGGKLGNESVVSQSEREKSPVQKLSENKKSIREGCDNTGSDRQTVSEVSGSRLPCG